MREWQAGTDPALIGETLDWMRGGSGFPFRSWAQTARFRYPVEAEEFLTHCDSAAEAYLLRPFCQRKGATFMGKTAMSGPLSAELQVKCAGYYIDLLVTDHFSSLAVEIDGLGFHHKTKEQVAYDYLRERRIVLRGHPLIRFTAQEAFTVPDKCWEQIEAILRAWGPKT